MKPRRALGRGLSALIPAAAPAPAAAVPVAVPVAPGAQPYFEAAIEDLARMPDQPRHVFDEQALEELAQSIREQGIIQPLLVRTAPGGGFIIVAGERRWRAAQRAGLKQVPVLIKEATDAQAFELALVENLQRSDLNPIEEAEAYRRLTEESGYTQETVAQRVGKDRSTVANALRLLRLPAPVRELCAAGQLSMGHARALLGLESEGEMERAARAVVSRGLSVRQAEQLVRQGHLKKREPGAAAPAAPEPSANVRDLETRLRRALGTKVRLVQTAAGSGRIEVDYASLDELDRLLELLLPS
ncbi:MAG TPA: ParB/RepB/Spo0J family partition protein [Polyangia bacterium]|jgi:ParB family chromosome partitioning protein